MPALPHTAHRRGPIAAFTLIELLTVIAIIGILAAIFIPTIGAVREKAQRAVDSNNLREITKAAMIYAADNNDRLPDPTEIAAAGSVTGGTNVYLWPGILAKNKILTDPTLYIAKNDPSFNGTYPAAIISTGDPTHKQLDADFAQAVLSWEFVGGLKISDPASTPVAYTRGLQAAGAWDAVSGVYKETGGFVAYLGGNVVFYNNTTDVFNSNNTGVKTAAVREAIPYTATIQSKIYGTAPTGGTILGSAAGTAAIAGN